MTLKTSNSLPPVATRAGLAGSLSTRSLYLGFFFPTQTDADFEMTSKKETLLFGKLNFPTNKHLALNINEATDKKNY